MQPSKEWVLPARAKPGRKPSESEPLTKRKAQNRASQRAFRERKQSYLSDLEAKVAAYEAAEIDRSVEIQKVAQKLRAENEALRKEVVLWKDKFMQIERVLTHARASGGRLPGVMPSVKSGPGCKAPAHERSAVAAPKRGVLVAPGAKSIKDKERNAGGVRFADAVQTKTTPDAVSPVSQQPIAVPLPLRRSPSSESAPDAQVQAGSPDDNIIVDTPAPDSGSQPVHPSATLPPPPKGVKPPLWSFESPKPPSPTTSDKTNSLLSPSLLPHRGHLSVDGGCGFCTEASPCVCADDFLDLSAQSQPSHIAVTSDVPPALPLPKRATDSSTFETSRRMSIGSLTHAKDIALDQRRRTTATKLWYTVTQPDSHSTSPPSPSSAVPLAIKSSTKKGGKKLWSITEASSAAAVPAAEPVCTGDPRTCGACSADPGLAAFCEAVTSATTTHPSSSSTTSSTAAAEPLLSPRRPTILRSGTTGQLPSSAYPANEETIPSAWRQIRSHPRFSQWQGGLDLLAEVVSKRSGNVHSPLLPHKRPREASVEIEPQRQTLASTSSDRATAKPLLLQTASDTTVQTVARVKVEQADGEVQREQKRRRIVIDREAVQEALALLDAGTAAQPRGSVGLGLSSAAKEEGPCPCPWRPGEKRSP